jgi:hypothetical protein
MGRDDVRIYKLDQVNFFVLYKQHLAEESRGENGEIVRIAGDIGGLHATGAATPYLSLFARMKDFSREQLDGELYSKRTLGKVRGVRGTVYIHPREVLPIAYTSNRRMNIPNSQRFYRYMDRSEEEYDRLSRRILQLLHGRGMTAAEIKRELGEEKSVSPVVNLMCDLGLLIRGAPAGGWKSNVHTYHILEEYMPGVNLASVEEKEARASMVRRYLAAFGPVCENDIAWWTAFRKSEVKEVLERLGDVVSQVRVEGMERDYFMLSSQDSQLVATRTPQRPVVNLLPSLDPYLMAYKERDRYLSRERYHFIYDRSGNATNCILLDGRIAGVWDYVEEDSPLFKWFLFAPVSERNSRLIRREALRLGVFFAGVEVELKECRDMIPLTERTAGAFMAPLKDAH